ncbi:hypothetical protein PR202_ga03986 [Eleusine coracana subsp. coracana]|uniref:Luminal-binding protein 5 n=1 Tax=Eleusine coracana subsp. coracana TaxID=191504 RepID=A0AAV5BNJ3_ELECO|nr:hypothetical protein PR202_ga03986 [Eleusine coracana subsp. coracana]
MAGNRRVGVATLQMLICLCLLAAAASGLEIPHYSRAYTGSNPEQQFGYTPGRVIVLDLGNTNSCVAGYGPGNTMFQFCVPSWVAFTEDGTTLVGDAARSHAEINPENAIFGLKRLLGQRRNRMYDEDIVQGLIQRMAYTIGTRDRDKPTIQVSAMDNKQIDVEKIVSMVIAQLKEKAEQHLGHIVEYAVLTIPQHFHGAATSSAVYAGKLARVEIMDDTILEPVAATVAHGLHRKLHEDRGVLVLYIGGVTTDASVVALWDGSLEVIGYQYDPFLQGDDFDQRIVDYFIELIKTNHGKDINDDRVALARLRTACERAKKALSSEDHAQVSVESLFDGVDFSEPLLRSEFEELNDELFGKVIALVDRTMVQDELEKNMIDEIVLVGGSAVIPKIKKLVKDYFGGKEPNISVKPDEAIALGAAVIVHS